MIRMVMSAKNVPQLRVVLLLKLRNYRLTRLVVSHINGDKLLCFGFLQDIADVIVEEGIQIQVGNESVVV